MTARGSGVEASGSAYPVRTECHRHCCGPRQRPCNAARRRFAGIEIAAHLIGEAAASTASVEHGEVRLEALQHNFGGVFFGAALIGPFARLQLASTQLDRSTLAAQRRPKAAPVAALAAVRAIAEGGLPLRKHQSSPYPARKQSSRILFERVSRPESFADISREILFIHRLAQVTQGPIVQGASPVKIARKRSHENRWNPLARIDKTPVEFEPRHGRHMDIGDQACGFREARGGEKFGCRRESVDRMAQRSHEPAHRFTKGPIIIDDRNQYFLHHPALAIRLIRAAAAYADVPVVTAQRMRECHQYNADAS